MVFRAVEMYIKSIIIKLSINDPAQIGLQRNIKILVIRAGKNIKVLTRE